MDTSEGAVAVGAVVVVKIFGLCSDIFFCFCFFLWRLGKQMDRPSLSCSLDKYHYNPCLLYTSPSPRDQRGTRMPSSA